MSNPNPEQTPDRLKEVLGNWQVKTLPPAGFQNSVWRRIETAEPVRQNSFWTFILARLTAPLRQPQMAAAYLAIVLLAGLAGGLWQGERKTEEWSRRQAARYLALVDPLQQSAGK